MVFFLLDSNQHFRKVDENCQTIFFFILFNFVRYCSVSVGLQTFYIQNRPNWLRYDKLMVQKINVVNQFGQNQ